MDRSSRSSARDYFLIALFGLLASAMLFQSYRLLLSTYEYIGILGLFIIAIACSILFAREFTSIVGIFLFSIVIRLMYYVSTRFLVFPYGDPYSQYSVLLSFAETSHVTIFKSPSFLNFITRIPHQYSQWPGIEAFSLSLSRITGLPVFWTALAMPFVLFSVWFLVSYAIVRKIFSARANSWKYAPTLSLVSIAIAGAIPAFELPPIFKYDFMAGVLLLAFILLLFYPFEKRILEKSVLLLLLVSAIVVTHSLTSLFLMILMFLVGASFVIRALVSYLPKRRRSKTQDHYRWNIPFPRLIAFILGAIAFWWTFYATFVQVYGGKTIPYIIHSFNPWAVVNPRIGTAKLSVLSALTSKWVLELLHYRDYALLALVAIGALILVIRPSFLGKRVLNTAILLSIGVVTIVTEVFKSLNFGDRAFLTFAPILACFIVVPIAVIASRNVKLAKFGAILLLVFFLFSIGTGFWGSSYAPSFLYTKSVSAYSFGEHPTDWQPVSTFLYGGPNPGGTNPSCILTNELFVTSLIVPVQQLGVTYTFTDVRPRSGCIAIIYDSLLHFNASYIAQPYQPYPSTANLPAFSDASFENTISNQSDLIFDGGNATVYYMP